MPMWCRRSVDQRSPIHDVPETLKHVRAEPPHLRRDQASFASSHDTEQLTGMSIGGVTPFSLPSDLPLWVDGRVMTRDRIVLGGGSRDRKILAPPSILTAVGAVVLEGLAREFS